MTLFNRNRFTSTPPDSVAQADAVLLLVRAELDKAIADFIGSQCCEEAPRRQVHYAAVQFAHRKLQVFLECRLELQRREQDAQVEAWWASSWPGTEPPAWPEGQGAA